MYGDELRLTNKAIYIAKFVNGVEKTLKRISNLVPLPHIHLRVREEE